MRLIPLLLCLPLLGEPLYIASDLGNKEGFLDFLSLAFYEGAGVKVVWQPLKKVKHLCQVQALLISKNALDARRLQNKKPVALFKESFILLGAKELSPFFADKSPKAVLQELARPAFTTRLKIMRNLITPYKPNDLILMSERLYLQKPPPLSVLFKPLNMHYFWLNPCNAKSAQGLLEWLKSHKDIFTDFRINYQSIFTPIEDDTYGD
ncbi:hypothetical protein [Helicobacter gastrofelis]|nr:hypothetical protein [Helicobacter sp. NHP19-012]